MTLITVPFGRIVGLLAMVTVLTGCPSESSVTDDEQAPPAGEVSNSPPAISGSPAVTATVGSPYSFVPTASDADGDPLTFSIANKPDWADFNTANGELSGTPGTGGDGTYADIAISVTDGVAQAALSPFTVAVKAAGGESPPPQPVPDDDYVGFGSATKGAMSCTTGMTTYQVTSLSGGSGAGTLRDAVSEDCRHVVFDVAGNIPIGDLQISKSYLTIDGSTAPAPGITLTNVGRLVLEASGGVPVHDIIVNNIRAYGDGGAVETDDLWELDGSSGAPVHDVVLDHLTMIGSADGNVDIYGDVHDVTLSNSLIFDSIEGHHFSESGGLRERITIYGNVYARLNERQPRIRYNTRQVDFVGNVIYGWGWYEGGASGMNIDVGSGAPSANVEQNVYLYVPDLSGSPNDALKIDSMGGSWFFEGNTWPGGETQGDGAANSNRISMVYNGVDYRAPRVTADVVRAGTHFPTAAETDLLTAIDNEVEGGGGEPPPEEPPPEEPPPEEPPPEEPPPEEPPPEEPPPEEPPPGGGGNPPGPSAYRGIPEPSDVFGYDVWADYTPDQVVTGSRGNATLSCSGTEANPCLIDASDASFTGLQLSGTYVILQGATVNAPAGNGPWFSSAGCNFCVIRDIELAGPGADSGHSSAVNMGNFNAWIRGSIHGFGDNRVNAGEQDFHGIKAMGSDMWILGAEIYDVSGDSVQVGDASRGAGNRVYIGGGYFHHNRENAVDIKDSRDVVVSGVLMEGFRPTSSSPGEALIVHDDAYDARIYDNIVRDATLGMVSSGKSGHIIDGNNVQALSVGIQLRNTQNITVTNNTVSAPTRIQVQGGITGTVQQ